MDALQAIFTRRSIRKYTDEPVTPQEEETLLRAAMIAPNTVNKRNWAFVVVRDPETMKKLSDAISPDGPALPKTPMAVIVCGDLSLTLRGVEEYWIQDCSLAAGNLLTAAHAMGLGAVWYGCHPQWNKVSAVSKLLELPRHIVPLCVIGVGHPAEQKPDASAERFEPHKIHHEKWNG